MGPHFFQQKNLVGKKSSGMTLQDPERDLLHFSWIAMNQLESDTSDTPVKLNKQELTSLINQRAGAC